MEWILSNLNLILGGAGAAIIGFIAIFLRKSGADAEKAKQVKVDQKADATYENAKADARALKDDDLNLRLRRWQGH